ncbi:bifunctional phosphoribosylaminoimidazolecarboxamide formyltransferase/IMP cyclohydrolase [Woeseiaceae bacterium]|nr:bifunctional phosphoribosylaminoimidazolecarboxamide formyltransferase/IMP cyclohydrolase [Woeseiaceae bacterium]
MFKITRALISVSDKSGLIDLANSLNQHDVEILSTGGTYKALRDANIPAKEVSEKTGFPEIMDGRVKTLHPIIHGGLLGRRGIDDSVMKNHKIEPIDLLVVNLYPFKETISNPITTLNEAIENIDIGGPAMIRGASKNHDGVAVLVDPSDYDDFLEKLNNNNLPLDYRQQLAAKAFGHTASYDASITQYLSRSFSQKTFTDQFFYTGKLISKLRYGENPHQEAAFYKDESITKDNSLASANQLQGKELSYNNISDSAAAYDCVNQFIEPACVIVKHANPCGVAVNQSILKAYQRAFSTDPTSAFGGIIAFNRPIDDEVASAILERQFVEVIIAPEITDAAKDILTKKENIRVLITGNQNKALGQNFEFKKVSGGMLIQTFDNGMINESDLKIVTKKIPTQKQIDDLLFAWCVSKFVKSNAIVFCKDKMTIGVGAGQMSRVYSTKIAAIKAQDENLIVAGSVLSSDAFFPFRDGIDSAAEHNVSAIIQPGGSLRDDEVINAANEHGIAMVFTNMRHFKH